MAKSEFEAQLWKQTRDDEDAMRLVFLASASEFLKAIVVPTRKALKITIEWED